MEPDEAETITPGRRLAGRVVATYSAPGSEDEYGFVTTRTDILTVTYEGIPDDRHFGWTRHSGSREPWYPRGTEMRNERQVSLLAPDELAEVAARLGIPEVKPEWIGGNLLIEGLPRLSMLPASTRLTFEGGAVVVIEAQNKPCRFSGRSIVKHYPDKPEIELGFTKVATRLRGLVGWVERPGAIRPGSTVSARIPEQWIYTADGSRSEHRTAPRKLIG